MLIGFGSGAAAQETEGVRKALPGDTVVMADTTYLFSPSTVRGLRGRIDSLLRVDSLRQEKVARLEENLTSCREGRAQLETHIARQERLLDDYVEYSPSIFDDIGTIGLSFVGGFATCQAVDR